MENYQKDSLAWVKAHKKKLIIVGISSTAIVGIILGLKNKDAIMALWSHLEKSIKEVPDTVTIDVPAVQASVPTLDTAVTHRSYTVPQEPFAVSQHIRTLSGGRQHSVEKAAEATALGMVLLPNQTLVDSYTKCAA